MLRASSPLAAALLALACAGPAPMRTTFPDLLPEDTDPKAGFERPPVLRASELLPQELREGPHHRVEEEIATDGFVRLYVIESDFGRFEARGDEMLRARVHEVAALAELSERSKTSEFAEAVGRALQSPFVATWNLVRDPVDTILGVPLRAWETLRATSDIARGERSEFEDGAFKAFIGFESMKRQLAWNLGVDPYSSNRVLQRELNRFAWAAYAGDLPARFVPFQHRELEVGADPMQRLEDWLLTYSPEDLRRLNRIEMAVMGVPEELTDRFIGHPWYSPRHATILVGSLADLDLSAGREAFIEAALRAESEEDAIFYQRVAEMIRAYDRSAGPVLRIVNVEGAVACYAEDGALVAPFVADHAVWVKPTARFAERFAAADPGDLSVARKQLLLSGTLSERARREIEALGIGVTEHAFQRLGPAEAAE